MIAENITSTIGAVQKTQAPPIVGRVNRILTRELAFVPNGAFQCDQKNGDQKQDSWRGCVRVDRIEDGGDGPKVTLRPGLPPHLLRLCEASIMTAEEEQAAFRRMNFLKYYYNHHRMLLNEEDSSESQLDMMKGF